MIEIQCRLNCIIFFSIKSCYNSSKKIKIKGYQNIIKGKWSTDKRTGTDSLNTVYFVISLACRSMFAVHWSWEFNPQTGDGY